MGKDGPSELDMKIARHLAGTDKIVLVAERHGAWTSAELRDYKPCDIIVILGKLRNAVDGTIRTIAEAQSSLPDGFSVEEFLDLVQQVQEHESTIKASGEVRIMRLPAENE